VELGLIKDGEGVDAATTLPLKVLQDKVREWVVAETAVVMVMVVLAAAAVVVVVVVVVVVGVVVVEVVVIAKGLAREDHWFDLLLPLPLLLLLLLGPCSGRE